jgi:DNA-binding transcriptional ArsR family regulator
VPPTPKRAAVIPCGRRRAPYREAISYALDHYPVVAIKENAKDPATRHGKNDATTEDGVLRAMLKPGHNLAIAWPTGVMVLDLDVPKDDDEPLPGARAYADHHAAELEARFDELKDAPRIRTRSDGIAWVVRLPDGTPAPSRVRVVDLPNGGGIDVRGDGRTYTLVEPSTINGKSYRWERKLCRADELPLASADLLTYFFPLLGGAGAGAGEPAFIIGAGGAARTLEEPIEPYVSAIIPRARARLASVKNGRNDAGYEAALTTGRWIGGLRAAGRDLLSEREAYDELLAAMIDNGDYADDPRKAEGTITRGLRDGMRSAYAITIKPRAPRAVLGRDPTDPMLAPAPDIEGPPDLAGGGHDDPITDPMETSRSKPVTPPKAPKGKLRAALQPYTARDLQREELPPVRWVVEDFLGVGLTLLAGPPKVGKSWLTLGLVYATAKGGRALGAIPVPPSTALYLALEDNKRRIKSRLERITGEEEWPANLHVLHAAPRLDEGLLEQVADYLDNTPDCRIIVVDTLARIRGARSRNDDAYSSDSRVMEGLQALAMQRDLAVIVVHHVRKQPGADIFETVSGTYGLTGPVDTIMVLERVCGEADAKLHITGRDVPESQLALKFNPVRALWSIAGDATIMQLSPERRRLLDAVKAAPGRTPTELARSTGLKLASVKHLLTRLRDAQLITADAAGRYHPLIPVHLVHPVHHGVEPVS